MENARPARGEALGEVPVRRKVLRAAGTEAGGGEGEMHAEEKRPEEVRAGLRRGAPGAGPEPHSGQKSPEQHIRCSEAHSPSRLSGMRWLSSWLSGWVV